MCGLTWADWSWNETGCEIQYSYVGSSACTSDWTPLVTVGPDSTQYDDVTVVPTVDYYYRIRGKTR